MSDNVFRFLKLTVSLSTGEIIRACPGNGSSLTNETLIPQDAGQWSMWCDGRTGCLAGNAPLGVSAHCRTEHPIIISFIVGGDRKGDVPFFFCDAPRPERKDEETTSGTCSHYTTTNWLRRSTWQIGLKPWMHLHDCFKGEDGVNREGTNVQGLIEQ